MYWLLSNLTDIFHDFLKKYAAIYKPEILDKLDLYLNMFDEVLKSYKIPNITKAKKFIACFSEKGDLLSQWRAYGDDGFGVSIGFDTKSLIPFENLFSYEFSKVMYSKRKILSFLKELIGEKLKYIMMDSTTGNSELSFNNLEFQTCTLIASIYNEGFIYKDPYFSEEKEWRLMREAHVGNWSKDDGIDSDGFFSGIEGFFADNVNGEFTRSMLKFNTAKNDLIPYIELGFEKIHSKLIKKIILGPKCKVDEYDLLLLLNSQDYIETVYDKNIEIRKSNIPYI